MGDRPVVEFFSHDFNSLDRCTSQPTQGKLLSYHTRFSVDCRGQNAGGPSGWGLNERRYSVCRHPINRVVTFLVEGESRLASGNMIWFGFTTTRSIDLNPGLGGGLISGRDTVAPNQWVNNQMYL